jgi:hypothetical protein
MILILILAIIIIAVGMFIVTPTLLDVLVDAYDEWKKVFDRIKRRIQK